MRNVALVLFCAVNSAVAQTPQTGPTPSIVYAVHNPAAIKDYKTNPRVVYEMVNRLVLAATGQSDVSQEWASLVSLSYTSGIKFCAAGGYLCTTYRDLVTAVVD